MGIIHPEARLNAGRWLLQCGLATLVILAIFLLLDTFLKASLVAALGATCFIVFAAPRSQSARPRVLLGGYLVGTFSGMICSLLASSSLASSIGIGQTDLQVVLGALAVGLSILVMAFTGTGHPPAAGLALGFVLSPWDYVTVVLVLSAGVLLTLARWLLRKVLVDLV